MDCNKHIKMSLISRAGLVNHSHLAHYTWGSPNTGWIRQSTGTRL